MFQLPYLNDSCTRARYASTLPFLIVTSSFTISATRRSRSFPPAVSTAFLAVSSPGLFARADHLNNFVD
jgi:hypothetical protein